MHRLWAWGLSAGLAVGAGALAASAGDDTPTPSRLPSGQTTVYDKLFGSKPKAGSKAAQKSASAAPPAAPAPLPTEVVTNALRAEQEALERRMMVCLKLRQVAVESNDEQLIRQVDELERQATVLYNTRVAALGVPKVKAPLPESPSAAALDKQLGKGVAVTPLSAPTTPIPADPAVRTAEARTPGDTIREVQP